MPVSKRVTLRLCPHAAFLLATAALVGHAAGDRALAASSGPETAPRKARVSHAKVPSAGSETIDVRAGAIGAANGETGLTPGGGLMRMQTAPKATSGVTRDFIAKQSPTQNPAALIASLPGVVYAANDPLGTNDDQQGLSVRGLDQTEIGYLFEGIPAAAPVYLLPYTSDAADSENIGGLQLTQGSPDPSSPVYNAVGGELDQTMREPAAKFGGLLNLSFGSYNLDREFIRVDSGEIGNSGIRSFISLSHRYADDWRGPGHSTRWHVDWKTVKEWGDGDRASFILSFTQPKQYYLRAPTKAQYAQYGSNFNYGADYKSSGASYYKFVENARGSLILGAPTKLRLSEHLRLNVTPCYTYAWGYGNGGTTLNSQSSYIGPYATGPLAVGTNAKSFTAVAEDTFQLRYGGINSNVAWTHGPSTLTAGYWYSYFDQAEPSSYASVDADGNVASQQGDYPLLTQSGRVLSRYDVHLVQQVNTLYLGEALDLLGGRLHLGATLKYAMLTRTETNLIPGAAYRNGESEAEPLPQLVASYKLTDHDQIYADATTSFRAPSSISTYEDQFSVTTGLQTRSHAVGIKPEFAIGEEIGYRHYGLVNVSVALFNYNFTNRQLSTTEYVNGIPTTNSINAGGQTSRGVDVELGLKPWHHFSPYVSAQYLHATIDNNLFAGTDYLPTAGKTAVRSPAFSGALGLSYDDGHVFGMFNMNHIGSQYATFMNDEKIPAFETYNLSLGYRFGQLGWAKHPEIILNLVNLGGGSYLSGVSGLQLNAKSTKGVYGNTIAGTAPTYYVGGGFAGIVSVMTAF